MDKYSQREQKLGVAFKNADLLQQALTHRSYLNENPSFRLGHNERLEFLGDAVLELVVTEALYTKFPDKPEGDLTSFRAALVNAKMLAEIAVELEINEFLLLSRGEAKDVGRARQYILANTFEAIVGALYLDGGYAAAKEFIRRVVLSRTDEVVSKKLYKDPKSLFQEEAQERASTTPTYEVVREWGPDHDKHFVVGVYLGKELIAEGEGPSKQIAQEEAARLGLHAKGWI
ncbi:MAG: ribonuclease III [Candidatus Sungbacteria bacterium]|nr:ribonuclease III [Candidatus Sungbacteria bacterium]